MDKISKALKKFNKKEKIIIKSILLKIKAKSFTDLNIQKLRGKENIFRVKKGKIRIIYKINENNNIYLLTIERRSDTTYNFKK